MPLKRVSYQGSDGRFKTVLLPESEHEVYAELRGIPVGPPDLSELGLPEEVEIRLNNELFHRGILTAVDALKRRAEITAALMAALGVDSGKIADIYVGKDPDNGSSPQSSEIKSNTSLPYRRRRRSGQRS